MSQNTRAIQHNALTLLTQTYGHLLSEAESELDLAVANLKYVQGELTAAQAELTKLRTAAKLLTDERAQFHVRETALAERLAQREAERVIEEKKGI